MCDCNSCIEHRNNYNNYGVWGHRMFLGAVILLWIVVIAGLLHYSA